MPEAPLARLRTHASAGATRKVNPTVRLPRSKIPTATAGCCRRSKRGFPAANGRRPRHEQIDVATLAELLRETEEHHGRYEKTRADHHWWDWYATYLSAPERQQSGGRGRSRRSLHGRGPPSSSPLMLGCQVGHKTANPRSALPTHTSCASPDDDLRPARRRSDAR